MKTINGCVSTSLTILVAAALHAAEYEIGGPLAGLKLPVSTQNTGSGPEVELYPGSVEHWRAYFMKYVPTRSFFDRQSQLKIWTAPALPGATPQQVEQYASPIYRQPENGNASNTGARLPPVPVIRCRVDSPVIALDLGILDVGLYAVRLVGAVETEKLRRFREPLFLRLAVNDGLNGETNRYRIRTGYVDEFYSVGDFYFHAPEKRVYQAELAVDRGSTVEVLIHAITLDDVLAGTVRRAIKTKRTLVTDDEIALIKAGATPETSGESGASNALEAKSSTDQALVRAAAKLPALSPEERLARDAMIWKRTPPLNTPASMIGGVEWDPAELGTPDKTAAQLEAEFGKWEAAGGREMGGIDPATRVPSRDPALANAFMVNTNLGLAYTMDDLLARKPLPDPYPVKDDGAGLYFPHPTNPAKGRLMAPISLEVGRRFRQNTAPGRAGARAWLLTGNTDFARDGAVALIRHAMQWPALEAGNFLNNIACIPQYQNRDVFCRQRGDYAMWLSHYENYLEAVKDYDLLFDYIRGNEELARSIGRFVPWVKTSEDVVKLLDVYLVQTTAKRILRYHYVSGPTKITDLAIALGDAAVTAPWMEWQFSRTFIYPLPPAGIQDLLISGCDREGLQYIGSTYYAQIQGGVYMAEPIARYIEAGGDPKFKLTDPMLYPKVMAQCAWQLNTFIGGADFARIGDVCGPDKSPYATAGQFLETAARAGWKWSEDPRFAWLLKNIFGRKTETAAEWAAVTAAAPSVKRAPWLDLPSRHVDNWFGVLETGLQHDDYRFRRAAYVRTGVGYGHHHADALDLQFFSHGIPMTIDGGQRSGYSKPNDKFARIHNTVEALTKGEKDDFGCAAYSWLTALSDAPGARYLQAAAPPPEGTTLFRRQVGLIDVDEGAGSEPLPVSLQKPKAKLKAGVTTANSYIFDVFRVSGGKLHSYGFHGPVNDDFQWNVPDAKPVAHIKPDRGIETDAQFLSVFELSPESKQAGDCAEPFQAIWRASRQDKVPGNEQQMLGPNNDAASPRKFTRLTLHGATGLRALKADSVSTFFEKNPYRFTQTMLQRRDPAGNLESAFAAIIEPYAGNPFITAQRLVPVDGNESDALRAVAIELQLKDGRTDICFADGRPERVREFQISDYKWKMAGEFAFVSTDTGGVRQATLTGGTFIEAPGIALRAARREYTAAITKVDYPRKTFWTDKPLPPGSAGRVFEIGAPGHPSSYTIASVVPEGGGSRVTVTKGADFYRSAVSAVIASSNQVAGALSLSQGRDRVAGMTLSNDTLTKFWRVSDNKGRQFKVAGAVTESDFAPANVMRLWEYGVGDTIRLSTFASVRRVGAGTFEITGDTDLELTVRGVTQTIAAADLARGPVQLPAK